MEVSKVGALDEIIEVYKGLSEQSKEGFQSRKGSSSN